MRTIIEGKWSCTSTFIIISPSFFFIILLSFNNFKEETSHACLKCKGLTSILQASTPISQRDSTVKAISVLSKKAISRSKLNTRSGRPNQKSLQGR